MPGHLLHWQLLQDCKNSQGVGNVILRECGRTPAGCPTTATTAASLKDEGGVGKHQPKAHEHRCHLTGLGPVFIPSWG